MSQDYLKSLENEMSEIENRVFGNQEQSSAETKVVEQSTENSEAQSSSTVEENTTVPSVSMEELDSEEIQQETPEQKKERNDWKKRYKNYKASTDITLFQLRQENATLNETIITLSKQVDTLKEQLQSKSSDNEDIYKDLFSQEEKDIVGEDTIATMKKATQAAVKAATDPILKQLEEERKLRLKERENRAGELSNLNQNTFLEKLENIAPIFRKYDEDPGFHKWMSEVDETSGLQRTVIFKNAQKIGDVGTVGRYFNEFDTLVTGRSKELDSHIAPSKSAAPVQTKQQQKPEVMTMAYINQFYDDVIMGKYKGRAKLKEDIERKIDDFLRRRAVK